MTFWSRRDGSCFLICFSVALTVYMFSLPPSITLEDAGELAVAADYLGVPHPPGYPIWTFLAWLFQWVFHFSEFRGYPNPARPIALMSAFFGSLACGTVSVCIRKLLLFLPDPGGGSPERIPARLKADLAGMGIGIFIFSIMFSVPSAGKTLATLGTLFFVLLLTFQSLRPLAGNPQLLRFPGPGTLGKGFWGFVWAAVSWLTLWSFLEIPTLFLMLSGSVLLLTAGVLIRILLEVTADKVLTQPDLSRNMVRSGSDILIPVSGGLMLAFSPLMWSQSVIVEVYSLNAFFLSLLLLAVIWYIHSPDNRILYTAAFVFSLGLTNHQSLSFLVFFLIAGVAAGKNLRLVKDGLFLLGAGILMFCFYKTHQYQQAGDPGAQKFFILLGGTALLWLICILMTRGGIFTQWKPIILLLLIGSLGLSFHLYMPLASEQNPPMNWGNARTVEGFVHTLTRGQYAEFGAAENFRKVARSFQRPETSTERDSVSADLSTSQHERALFVKMLGAYFWNPQWKYSIASQFSWQFPEGTADPTGTLPPPEEKHIPLALTGLLPLFCFMCFPSTCRKWFICSLVAMFFLTVVFLLIQWPQLTHNDLWVKRVQYVQAHVLFSVWMTLGAALLISLLHFIRPRASTLAVSSLALGLVFVLFPLHKDASDPKHLEHLGSSSQRGHVFGWEYGFHQLKGANGILLDELSHHENPDSLLNDWAVSYLEARHFPDNILPVLSRTLHGQRMPESAFMERAEKEVSLSQEQRRLLVQAVTLAAFRSLSPGEQQNALKYLHRPLPDWDYPPELDQGGILFGGTDPGRFVPTYLVFSAQVRQDISVLTQTALAERTYQITTRDYYGDRIYLPDLIEGNEAFLEYGNQLRIFRPRAFGLLMGGGETMAVSGVDQVHEVNSLLARQILEKNPSRSFYLEEAIQIDWMVPHLKPHGLIFKLEKKASGLSRDEIRKDAEFWDWYEEHLLGSSSSAAGKRSRFHRDLQVRKSFSKLRMSQAWNYYSRGHWLEAEEAMEQALRLYPANPEASLRAGDMYIRMLKFDKAEKILSRFAGHDPENPQRNHFERSLKALRELNRERIRLEKDFELQPSGNLALQLMQIYGELEMQEQEKEMAEVILRRPRLHVDFYIHLAAYMQREENAEYYKKAVQKWMEKDPEDARPLIDLAVFALAEGQYREMYGFLLQAVRLSPLESRRQLAADPRFSDIRHWQQFQQVIRPLPKGSDPAGTAQDIPLL